MSPESDLEPVSKPDVVHTEFIEGAIYEKRVGDDVLRGMIISSVKKPNGIRSGTMVCQGFVSEKVIEGTESLDVWKRVHLEAVSSAANVAELVVELKERIEKLEAAAKTPRK